MEGESEVSKRERAIKRERERERERERKVDKLETARCV